MSDGQTDLRSQDLPLERPTPQQPPLGGSALDGVGLDGVGLDGPAGFAPRDRPAAGSIGLLLDGRYRLDQRRTRNGPSSTWDGYDDLLRRAVAIRVVAGPTAAGAVDAARATTALEDVRLPRVLDVGTTSGADGGPLGWVVTEQPAGRSLLELLRDNPLAASRVRAMVGEAAALLSRASAAGLHHRQIDPTTLVVTGKGGVSVLGLQIAAAAAGLPPVSSAQAQREDVVGLVSLLYAGLTGLWPGARFASLGAAPSPGGAPVAPGELVTGVPRDLDVLVTSVLGGAGPTTPAELVDHLAPWGGAAGPFLPPSGPLRVVRPGQTPPTGTISRSGGPDTEAFAALVAATSPRQDPGACAPPQDAAWDASPLAEEEAPLRRGAGRVVVGGIAVVLVAVCAVALTHLPTLKGVLGAGSTPAATSPVTGSVPSPSGTAPAATTPPVTAVPLGVVAVRALDPLGDGSENDASLPKVIDGDPGTAWSSSTYRSATFGSLKSGLGLALDLGAPGSVSAVDLSVAGTGGTVEVRSSADGAFAGSTVMATADVGSGSADPVHVSIPAPVKTRWVVLWFTQLPAADGGYRATVSQVAVS